MRKLMILVSALWSLSGAALCEWMLDPTASHLTYVTVKNGSLAEVNRFTDLLGGVSEEGEALIDITMASVDTGIDIRNERVRDLLFEIGDYPLAQVSALVEMDALKALEPGDESVQDIELTVNAHGQALSVPATVRISMLAPDRVRVTSTEPLIIYADDLDFVAGLQRLREIAGLESISPAVPVSFSLAFDKGK